MPQLFRWVTDPPLQPSVSPATACRVGHIGSSSHADRRNSQDPPFRQSYGHIIQPGTGRVNPRLFPIAQRALHSFSHGVLGPGGVRFVPGITWHPRFGNEPPGEHHLRLSSRPRRSALARRKHTYRLGIPGFRGVSLRGSGRQMWAVPANYRGVVRLPASGVLPSLCEPRHIDPPRFFHHHRPRFLERQASSEERLEAPLTPPPPGTAVA